MRGAFLTELPDISCAGSAEAQLHRYALIRNIQGELSSSGSFDYGGKSAAFAQDDNLEVNR
jgi:hypothetical protein